MQTKQTPSAEEDCEMLLKTPERASHQFLSWDYFSSPANPETVAKAEEVYEGRLGAWLSIRNMWPQHQKKTLKQNSNLSYFWNNDIRHFGSWPRSSLSFTYEDLPAHHKSDQNENKYRNSCWSTQKYNILICPGCTIRCFIVLYTAYDTITKSGRMPFTDVLPHQFPNLF